MSTVTIDLSKAQPITGASAAPPTVDMSKATPILPGGGGGLGVFVRKYFQGSPEEQEAGWGNPVAAGMVKSAGRGLATVLDMLSGGVETRPGSPAASIVGHMQNAANWLKEGSAPEDFGEKLGAIGEQILEYMGTDGLLKLAGPAVKTTATGARIVDAAKNLKMAQQAAEFLTAHPKIAGLVGIGLKASQEAAMMGGQTYLHTEDPRQAAIAAGAGGVLSAAAGGGQAYLERIAPRTIAVGGEETPALASQVNEAGEPIETGAIGAPKIARMQQEAGRRVIQNTAQQATAQAIDRIARSRPMWGATEEAGRMLPAPEGAQPFTFTRQGAPEVAEETTGQMAQPAAKVPGRAAFKQPQYTTSSTEREIARQGPQPAPREAPAYVGAEGQMGADIRSAGPPQVAEDVARGGGVLRTTDPNEAENWLQKIEDLQSTREYRELPQARQDAIEAERQGLQAQLGLYWRSPYGQRFVAPNIWDHIEDVQTFGDAASQIKSVAQPVFAKLDVASGGKFEPWREIAKRQLKVMRNPSSEQAYQSARTKYQEAQGAIEDLINRHRGEVSMADYMTAREAWRHASRLDELHSVFEGMMNGVSAEEGEQGLTRIMTGRARALENYLSEGTNRGQIEQLIGKEGATNLKRITLLLAKANTARATQNVAANVAMHLGQHIEGGGWSAVAGAGAGATIAQALGIPHYYGAIAGAVGTRAVLRIAATSPRIGNMVEYAVQNGLSAQQYAPLIARAIAVPLEKPEQEEEQGETKP